MLSALLLAGLFAAPLATVGLFVPASGRAGRAEEPSKRAARFGAALPWSAIVIAVVALILLAIGVTTGHIEEAVVGLALATIVWLPATRCWNARAHACWATTTYVFVVYLVRRQCGFDAARLPIWFATACSGAARGIAAGWWSDVLAPDGRAGAQALTLDGGTIDDAPSPLQILAGAAAATAAGDSNAAKALRVRATALAREDPTYYGDAWAALGPALLDGSISPCDEVDVARSNRS
jgi:hypothetical protein